MAISDSLRIAFFFFFNVYLVGLEDQKLYSCTVECISWFSKDQGPHFVCY